jgi:hypothetical protein
MTRIPATYVTPREGRPSSDTISNALGFTPPVRFSEFVVNVYDLAGGDRKLCLEIFHVALGLFPSGASARYSGTPPELFPIGQTGCDGDHYGFLLHAPELKQAELPFCHYCPMDSDGVILVGSTTARGIGSLMGARLSYGLSEEDEDLIASVAKVCRIVPEEESVPRVSVPEGWRFLPSSDGVGTLAPSEWFAPGPLAKPDRYGSPDPFLLLGDTAIKNRFYATALHYLREGLWFFGHGRAIALTSRMVEVYLMMNRSCLADELNRTMARWQETEDHSKSNDVE